jgi:hypothetical protein
MCTYCRRSSTVAWVVGFTLPPPGMLSDMASVPSVWIDVESTPRGLGSPACAPLGPSTAAPAPSPKRMHVVRSVQSTTRDRSSTPMTSTCFICPEAMKLSAMERPKTNPAQAALRSKAGHTPAPSFCCTKTAVAGIGMSGVTVPTTIMSRSLGRSPAMSRAFFAAAVAMSLVFTPSGAM